MINRNVFQTFQIASIQLGLLEEDKEKTGRWWRFLQSGSTLNSVRSLPPFCCIAFWQTHWHSGRIGRARWKKTSSTRGIKPPFFELTMHLVSLKLQEKVDDNGLDLHFDFWTSTAKLNHMIQAQISNVITEETLHNFHSRRSSRRNYQP